MLLIKAAEEKELGNAAYKKKDFEVAIAHYTKAIEYDPNNVTFYTNRGGKYMLFLWSFNCSIG